MTIDFQGFLERFNVCVAEFDAYDDAVAKQSAALKHLSHVKTQNISTATILVTLTPKSLDLKSLDRAIREATENGSLDKLLEVHGKIKARVKPREENKKSFNNSITLSFEEVPWDGRSAEDRAYNNKAIKFFSNGNLHITGYIHVRDCVHGLVAKRVLPLLGALLKVDPMTYFLTDFDVQMINTDTSLERDVLISDLKTYLDRTMTQHDYVPFYNQEQHLALRLSCKERGHTIMLFSNGKLLINAPTPGEVVAARKFIIELLDAQHARFLEVPRSLPRAQHAVAPKKKQKTNDFLCKLIFGQK